MYAIRLQKVDWLHLCAYYIYILYIYIYIYILSLYKSFHTNKLRPITPIIYRHTYIYIIIIYAFRQLTIMFYYNKAFIIKYTSITVYVTLEDCLIPRISIRKVRDSNTVELLEVRIPDSPVTCESVLMVLAMYNILSHPEPQRTPELRTCKYN